LLPFFFIALVFSAWFFRDPDRIIPEGENILVSPADGHVVAIDQVEETGFFNTRVKRVSIFLSVFDIHVNRAPINGVIEYQKYRKGKFLAALNPEASEVNEQNIIGINRKGLKVIVVQIAGLIARRIVPWKGLGDKVDMGSRIGMIRFGSRTDLLFPENFEVCVRKGQKVRGGIDVIARSGE
jgi:phosphatidylserine decarboxylase